MCRGSALPEIHGEHHRHVLRLRLARDPPSRRAVGHPEKGISTEARKGGKGMEGILVLEPWSIADRGGQEAPGVSRAPTTGAAAPPSPGREPWGAPSTFAPVPPCSSGSIVEICPGSALPEILGEHHRDLPRIRLARDAREHHRHLPRVRPSREGAPLNLDAKGRACVDGVPPKLDAEGRGIRRWSSPRISRRRAGSFVDGAPPESRGEGPGRSPMELPLNLHAERGALVDGAAPPWSADPNPIRDRPAGR
jgi:hypothetical protein